jgi:curved DNA-binding protein CbpA
MYFENCHTAAECKARYRELAKQLHSDKPGGSDAAFQTMKQEYEARLCKLQRKAPINSHEATELTKAILELLRITKPEYYELVRRATAIPTLNMFAAVLGNLFPEKKGTLNGILSLLQ